MRIRRAVSVAVALLGLSLLCVSGASAETYSVKTTAEFTAAVSKANAATGTCTIVVAAGIYQPTKTVTFTNKSCPLTIEGPSGSPAVKGETAKLDGGEVLPFPSELFIVEEGVSVTFKDVDVTHGGGSGIATIEDFGSLGVESSTIAGNTGAGAVIQPGATTTVRNSTISDGSGFGVIDDGTANFFNSTVAFNKDGGLENKGTLNLTNTIVAENTGSGDCEGKATTSDNSLDSDGSCGVGALSSTNPNLQTSLRNDGGTTPIHSLKPGSPAIGKGDSATCTTSDQRGAPRAKPCSIGADEYTSTPPTIKVPAEITTEATSSEGAAVEYTVEATGVNSAIHSLTCTTEPGATFPIGTTEVTCTAIDGHENKVTASFNVTVTPKGAPPPPAPTVVTGNATSVAQTTATLNASVNPNGGNVSACEFEYGTSTSYGKTVACSTLPGSGTSAVSVSAPLTGLSADTTYDYRISATDTTGTSQGSNETLKTLEEVVVAPAPTVVTGAATSVAQTTATLNATVNPNGANVSACEFEYGTSTSYGKTVACSSLPGSGTSAVSVSAPLKGLSANTTYDYRISATNATGPSKGSNESFKTLEEAVLPPPAPTVVTGSATSVGQISATLNATVNPNGANVSACEFEYGTSTSYGKTVACSTLPGSGTSAVSVSAAPTGLLPGTTYDYRISATNTTGTSQGSNETFETLEGAKPGAPAPAVVTGAATSVTQTTATLNATVNPEGANISACEFEYGTSTSYGKTVACSALPGSGTSAVSVSAPVSGLSADTTYDYRISATNVTGTSKGSNETLETLEEVTVTPPVPTVVTGAATSVTQTTATLDATVNPNGANVSECEFEYGTSTSYGKTVACSALPGSGTSAVSVSAPVSGLSAGTTYDYRISATNVTGTNQGLNETLETLEEVKVAPPAPTVVTGAATSVAQTTATLNATVNPNGANVSACEFEYGTSTSYGKTVACSSLPGSGSSAVSVSAPLTGLSGDTTYDYRISATNVTGTSKGLNETLKTEAAAGGGGVSITVITGTATSVTQTMATLNATVNPNGANVSACEFEYGTSTSYGKTVACSSLPGSGTSAVSVSAPVSGLSADTSYDYRISATNVTGTGKGSNETLKTLPEVTVTPLAPTLVTGTATSVAQTTATLNATVNPNGGEVSACQFEYGTSTSYGKVAKCSTSAGSGSSAVSVSAAITGLTANTTYHFRITATNTTGTSRGSDESLKTLAESTTPPAQTVEARIRALLQEVITARIPYGIRSELSSLLQEALRSVRPSRGFGYGSTGFGGRSVANVPALFGPLQAVAPLQAVSASRHSGCTTRQAYDDLEQFIAAVEHGQGRRRPQIPASLASAWSQTAEGILASLSCGSDIGYGRSGGR